MSEDAFGPFVAQVRAEIDAWLERWLAARVEEARGRGAAVEAVADAGRELVLRGGKRVRAALLAAAYEACGGDGSQRVVAAGAALELLQGYLLTHDDWMDGDDVRRGGPSVPALMRERFGKHGDAMSVLAGDLWRPGRSVRCSSATGLRRACSARGWSSRAVHEDVVEGQVLDVACQASDAAEVSWCTR